MVLCNIFLFWVLECGKSCFKSWNMFCVFKIYLIPNLSCLSCFFFFFEFKCSVKLVRRRICFKLLNERSMYDIQAFHI